MIHDSASLDTTPYGFTQLPAQLASYKLLRLLGRGGMGQVFLASHGDVAGIRNYCIVKTLLAAHTDKPEYVNRFIDEARIVVRLNHRNICHVFDVGKFEGGGETQFYLAMEFVAGQTIAQLHRRLQKLNKKLDPALAVYLTMECLDALDYAHRYADPQSGEPLHIVHRDVSPHNAMVNYEGEVKLIDFGLADSDIKMEETGPLVVMGKLGYISPEQVRNEPVDGRTDLFAAAIMLYELLSGDRFYEGISTHLIWNILSKGGYRPPHFDELDMKVRSILSIAMDADPDRRFKTCEHFYQALKEYSADKGYRAGRRELRSLLNEVFASEQEELKRILAHPEPRATSPDDMTLRHSQVIAQSEFAADPNTATLRATPSPVSGVDPAGNSTSNSTSNAMTRSYPQDLSLTGGTQSAVPWILVGILSTILTLGVGVGAYFYVQGNTPTAEVEPVVPEPIKPEPIKPEPIKPKPSLVEKDAGTTTKPPEPEPVKKKKKRRRPTKKKPTCDLQPSSSSILLLKGLKEQCGRLSCTKELNKDFGADSSLGRKGYFKNKLEKCRQKCKCE